MPQLLYKSLHTLEGLENSGEAGDDNAQQVLLSWPVDVQPGLGGFEVGSEGVASSGIVLGCGDLVTHDEPRRPVRVSLACSHEPWWSVIQERRVSYPVFLRKTQVRRMTAYYREG